LSSGYTIFAFQLFLTAEKRINSWRLLFSSSWQRWRIIHIYIDRYCYWLL